MSTDTLKILTLMLLFMILLAACSGVSQAFSLQLTDGVGRISSISLTGEPALAFPYGIAVTLEDRPDRLIWEQCIAEFDPRAPDQV